MVDQFRKLGPRSLRTGEQRWLPAEVASLELLARVVLDHHCREEAGDDGAPGMPRARLLLLVLRPLPARPPPLQTRSRSIRAILDTIGILRRVTTTACLLALVAIGPVPAPAEAADPVLVGAGDIASCSSSGDSATAKLLLTIAGTVFTTGDNAYNGGTATEYANCYGPTWGQVKSRTRPTAGNHDYATTGAAGYFGYFGSRAGSTGKGYYAYNLGSWRIYALNSNCGFVGCGATSAQARWLKADLAANPHRCVLAYWHHPLFSSGAHGNNTSVKPLWNILYAYHADVVVNGHDHDYERFARQSPSGSRTVRGISEFVVGTGGRSHYAWGSIKRNSVARNNTTYGVIRLTLRASSYSWRFHPVAGKTWTDSGTTSCG